MVRRRFFIFFAAWALAPSATIGQARLSAPAAAQASAQTVLHELLATERALSDGAANLTPAEGIASLLAKDGVLFTRPAPVTGHEAAVAALEANAANSGKNARWRSIRGGVSADGLHGFTLGVLEIEGGEPKTSKRRYLAYWVRGDEGWRVAVMKQILQNEKEQAPPVLPPALPARPVLPDPAQIPTHAATLMAAEKAFSERAQIVGLRQAFYEYGRPDAVHILGRNGFAVGLQAIAANFEEQPGVTSPADIEWSADRAIVASSGDLGVNIGRIRRKQPAADGSSGSIPFFTIWRRDDPSHPWRYVAE